MKQQTISTSQFGGSAANYLASEVHARGADLESLAHVASGERSARVLDLGCGAGHASFACARGGAGRITAYDPSPQMLAVVAEEAARRGHSQIEIQVGAAETLPFAATTFDLIVTRYSAHHWANVPQALAECARVLAPGGRLIVIDLIAPELPLLDTSLQVIEFLRDASHVRDYRLTEWSTLLQAAFDEPRVTGWKLPMEFQSWIARIGTPPARVVALKAVFDEFPGEAREYFQVSADNSFVTDAVWLETRLRAV